MILPAWQTDISQSQVQDALYITGAPLQSGFSLLYSSSMETASAYNSQLCLMYHNLAMGVTNTQTAKQAIYDNYNNGTNLNLGNWASYDNEGFLILTWTITNNNIENSIMGNIHVVDTSFTSIWSYNYNVAAGGGTDNQTNYNSVLINTMNTKYAIALDATAMYVGPPPAPGGGVTGNTTAATDTDGVGGGTARFVYNPVNFDAFNPIQPMQMIVNCTNGATADIAVNKRTSFDIVFN